MDVSLSFRQSLRRRLLLIATAAMLPAGAAGCDKGACFRWDEDKVCPSKDEARQHMSDPSCEERIVSIDSEGEHQDELCCYEITTETLDGCVIEGRPLRIGGAPRWARAARGRTGWSERGALGGPDCSELTEAARAALASHWTRAALLEHASIAEFSRCSLDLLAVGAPADLVADAHAAALDEIRHAKLSFALAAAYAGEPIGPAALPLGGGMELRTDFAAVAAAAARDGCVNETIAALLASEQHARATDPAVREVLAMLAEDEARHAELAWRTVRWAIEVGGQPVRRAVSEAFAAAANPETRPVESRPMSADLAPDAGAGDDALAGHGLLAAEAVQAVVARGLAEVVLPCAEALLRGAPGDGDAARVG